MKARNRFAHRYATETIDAAYALIVALERAAAPVLEEKIAAMSGGHR
jgi:hypothetical protein